MKTEKSVDNLRYVWFSLYALGIHSHAGSSISKAHLAPFILLSVPLFISGAVYINISLRVRELHRLLAPGILLSTTLAMYLSLFRRQKHLRLCRQYLTKNSNIRNTHLAFFQVLILLAVSKPVITPVAYLLYNPERLGAFTLYSFEDGTAQNALDCVAVACINVIGFAVPSVLTCAFCAVCRQCAYAVSSLKRQLRAYGRQRSHDRPHWHEAAALLRKCRSVWRGTEMVQKTFSPFLFYAISMQIVGMFLGIAFVMDPSQEGRAQLETYAEFGIFAFSFGATVHQASRVPEEMEGLVSELTALYENIVFETTDPGDLRGVLGRLRMVVRKQPIAFSVGGWASLRKSFILVTFGSIFTYGMIIVKGL